MPKSPESSKQDMKSKQSPEESNQSYAERAEEYIEIAEGISVCFHYYLHAAELFAESGNVDKAVEAYRNAIDYFWREYNKLDKYRKHMHASGEDLKGCIGQSYRGLEDVLKKDGRIEEADKIRHEYDEKIFPHLCPV